VRKPFTDHCNATKGEEFSTTESQDAGHKRASINGLECCQNQSLKQTYIYVHFYSNMAFTTPIKPPEEEAPDEAMKVRAL